MCVLEHVNVLEDALDLEVVALYFIMQHQEVEGVPAGTPCLEACKDIFGNDIGVKRVGVAQFADPGVGDDGEHELSHLLLRRFLCSTVCALGFVCRYGARTDGGRIVVVDNLVVCPDSCWLEKRLAVESDICGLQPNKAYQILKGRRTGEKPYQIL